AAAAPGLGAAHAGLADLTETRRGAGAALGPVGERRSGVPAGAGRALARRAGRREAAVGAAARIGRHGGRIALLAGLDDSVSAARKHDLGAVVRPVRVLELLIGIERRPETERACRCVRDVGHVDVLTAEGRIVVVGAAGRDALIRAVE